MLIEMGWTPPVLIRDEIDGFPAPAPREDSKRVQQVKAETHRLLNLRNQATKGPWKKRQGPTEFQCFVEGPRPENMAYSCEILGDDYTGFGDKEQRMHDVEFVAAAHEMADHIERLQTELDTIKGH